MGNSWKARKVRGNSENNDLFTNEGKMRKTINNIIITQFPKMVSKFISLSGGRKSSLLLICEQS